jgi:signal transduction histidine kinase
VAGWLAVVLAVSEVVRTRREQAADRRRAAQDEVERRRGEQRLGLAQELHDVLAHNISLINVQASVALHLIDEQPDQVRPALTTIKEASRDALHELRSALDLLRRGDEAPLAPAPRLADLDRLLAGVRSSGLHVRLEHDGTPPALPAAVELAAYRIVQEALTNITRHAHARHVSVRIGYADGVSVEVTDDGVGGAAPAGNGITGMRERAAALGGSVETGPRAGGGFRVAAHLPNGAS